MRIGPDGSLIIPEEIRLRVGLMPDAEVSIEVEGNAVRIAPAGAVDRGRRAIELLRGAGDINLSTDDIMAMTRGE